MGDRAEVLASLRAAFPAQAIAAAKLFDQRGWSYPDADAYIEKLDGKTWEQFDPDFAMKRVDGLGFLSDAGRAAVLPLYLRLLLETQHHPNSVVRYSLLPLLTRPVDSDSPRGGDFTAFVAALTAPQRTAVRAVLKQFAAENPDSAAPAFAALDSFWR